jgi:hypothetical protein
MQPQRGPATAGRDVTLQGRGPQGRPVAAGGGLDLPALYGFTAAQSFQAVLHQSTGAGQSRDRRRTDDAGVMTPTCLA